MDNSHCGLELIDLSNNNIEDRGAIFLSGPLPMMKAGKLTSLIISKTGKYNLAMLHTNIFTIILNWFLLQ